MSRMNRPLRWVMLIASGCMLFQSTSQCDLQLQFIQTGLLAGIAGGMYYLARNI